MKKHLFLVLLPLILIGCDSDDPGDNVVLFQLFPDGYFSLGYQEQYNMTGQSNSGATFQGTHLVLNEGNDTFDGQQSIAIRVQNDWTDINSNQFANGVTQYYSADQNNRRLLGTIDLFTSEVFVLSSPGVLPITAEVGESGTIGVDTNIANETVTQTWALNSGSGNSAVLIFSTEIRDASGNLLFEGNTSYVIDEDGNRQSIGILFDVKAFADPVNWSGDRI